MYTLAERPAVNLVYQNVFSEKECDKSHYLDLFTNLRQKQTYMEFMSASSSHFTI